MTASNIPYDAPRLHTRPAKRTPPDPQRVFETYQYECKAHGEWGAYTRTGHRYERTPEWARKTIAKYRAMKAAQEAAAAEANELAYIPPPDAYPVPVPAPVVIPTPTLSVSNSPPTDGAGITSSTNGNALALQPATGGDFQPIEPDDPDERPPKRGPHTPGHARPDVNEPGSEAPELPPESFSNPQPNQPTPTDDPEPQPSGPPYAPWQHSDSDEPRPRGATSPIVIRQVVRLPAETPRHDLYSRLAATTGIEPRLWWALVAAVLLVMWAF